MSERPKHFRKWFTKTLSQVTWILSSLMSSSLERSSLIWIPGNLSFSKASSNRSSCSSVKAVLRRLWCLFASVANTKTEWELSDLCDCLRTKKIEAITFFYYLLKFLPTKLVNGEPQGFATKPPQGFATKPFASKSCSFFCRERWRSLKALCWSIGWWRALCGGKMTTVTHAALK